MVLQQVWNRFTADWKSFAMLGIGPALSSMAVTATLGILALIMVGPGIFAMVTGASRYGRSGIGVFAMLGGMVLFAILALAVMVLASSLISAGLVGSVVAYRRGEAPGLPAFWAYSKTYFRRFLGLGALAWGGIIAGFVVTSPLLFIPVIGWLAVIGIQSILLVNLAVYPAYLIVSQEISALDAVRTSFGFVTQNFREACLSGLVLLGFNVAVGVASAIPVLGQLASLAVSFLYGPVMVYYFAERFELLVRPSLGGSAPGQA